MFPRVAHFERGLSFLQVWCTPTGRLFLGFRRRTSRSGDGAERGKIQKFLFIYLFIYLYLFLTRLTKKYRNHANISYISQVHDIKGRPIQCNGFEQKKKKKKKKND